MTCLKFITNYSADVVYKLTLGHLQPRFQWGICNMSQVYCKVFYWCGVQTDTPPPATQISMEKLQLNMFEVIANCSADYVCKLSLRHLQPGIVIGKFGYKLFEVYCKLLFFCGVQTAVPPPATQILLELFWLLQTVLFTWSTNWHYHLRGCSPDLKLQLYYLRYCCNYTICNYTIWDTAMCCANGSSTTYNEDFKLRIGKLQLDCRCQLNTSWHSTRGNQHLICRVKV